MSDESKDRRDWLDFDPSVMSVVDSFADADRQDREFWLSRTPLERMQALEMLREQNFGYGQGKPIPAFQRILNIVEFRGS
jgi:hypothetical protein